MSKIYISGPISGYDLDERRRLFGKVENCLSHNGYEVFNPLKNGLPDDAAYEEHMRADIRMLTECDAIVFLSGWADSAGCRVEFIAAVSMGIEMLFEWDKASSIVLERIYVSATPDCDCITFRPGWDIGDPTAVIVRTFFNLREGKSTELRETL